MSLRIFALWLLLGSAVGAPAAAQHLYATPEVGWTELRGATIGGRVGLHVVGGLELVGQALLFFPDEDGVADPGLAVSRGSWQLNGNVLYHFDPSRAIPPYAGLGMRYARAHLSLPVDGLRSTSTRAGWKPNLILGVRLPRLPADPLALTSSQFPGSAALRASSVNVVTRGASFLPPDPPAIVMY